MSTVTSPQILLQSSCLQSAEGLTRSLAAGLQKISLGGRTERSTFRKCLSIQCGRLWFSQRLSKSSVHSEAQILPWSLLWSPLQSSPLGHRPEQGAVPRPAWTLASQPPRHEPGRQGLRLQTSTLVATQGSHFTCLSTKLLHSQDQDSPSHLTDGWSGTQRAWISSVRHRH